MDMHIFCMDNGVLRPLFPSGRARGQWGCRRDHPYAIRRVLRPGMRKCVVFSLSRRSNVTNGFIGLARSIQSKNVKIKCTRSFVYVFSLRCAQSRGTVLLLCCILCHLGAFVLLSGARPEKGKSCMCFKELQFGQKTTLCCDFCDWVRKRLGLGHARVHWWSRIMHIFKNFLSKMENLAIVYTKAKVITFKKFI